MIYDFTKRRRDEMRELSVTPQCLFGVWKVYRCVDRYRQYGSFVLALGLDCHCRFCFESYFFIYICSLYTGRRRRSILCDIWWCDIPYLLRTLYVPWTPAHGVPSAVLLAVLVGSRVEPVEYRRWGEGCMDGWTKKIRTTGEGSYILLPVDCYITVVDQIHHHLSWNLFRPHTHTHFSLHTPPNKTTQMYYILLL